MPHCPKCSAEVDADQVMCAWCGFELKAKPSFPPPPPRPAGEVAGEDGAGNKQAHRQAPQEPPAMPKTLPLTPPEPAAEAVAEPERIMEADEHQQYSISEMLSDARELGKIGDYDASGEIFERVLEKQPENHEALFGLGAVHFRLHEYQEATHWWHKLSMICPEYPKIDMWLRKSRDAHTEEVARPESSEISPVTIPAPVAIGSAAEARALPMPAMAVRIGTWLLCLALAGTAVWMLLQD